MLYRKRPFLSPEIDFRAEEAVLRIVHTCLKRTIAKLGSEEKRYLSDIDQQRAERLIEWGRQVVEAPWKLGELVGKAAAQLWLYEDL